MSSLLSGLPRLLQSPQRRLYGIFKARSSSTTTSAATPTLTTSTPPSSTASALPAVPARTRFAPSPTGYLHLGSLRTALFSYLLAKRTGGQFVLRIEDTDQKRTVADAESRLIADLRWAGIHWDEGPGVGGPYGPYRQSERSHVYQHHARRLLDAGHAYRCFCSPERLHALAEHRHRLGLATEYDRACAPLSRAESDERAHRGELHTIRLRAPDRYPAYRDLVYGTVKPLARRGPAIDAAFDDPILLKSDGLPTYHLASVVDDHLMHITHVIRGSEWMPSTPKHMALYAALGWTPPAFAHVGLLVDEQGNKLSKRNFDTDVAAFREMDLLPETLTNFAALLGWSHKEKSDVMDLRALVDRFNLKFTKGNTTVTFGKLHFLQRKHAAVRAAQGGDQLRTLVDAVATRLVAPDSPYTAWSQVVGSPSPHAYIAAILAVDAENYTNANEFLYRNSFFFRPLRPDPNAPSVAVAADIPVCARELANVPAWTREALMQSVREIIDGRAEGKAGSKDVYHYLRRALTGQEQGMRIYDVMLILGRTETLARLGVVEDEL